MKGRLLMDPSAGTGTPEDWKDVAVTFAASDLPPPPAPLPRHPLPDEERERLQAEAQRIYDLRSSILSAFPVPNGGFQSPEGLAPGEYVLGIHWIPESPKASVTPGGQPELRHDPTIRHLLRWAHLKRSTPFLAIPFRIPPSDKPPENQARIDLGEIPVRVPPS